MPKGKLEGVESLPVEAKDGPIEAKVYHFSADTSNKEALAQVGVMERIGKASTQVPQGAGGLSFDTYVRQNEVIEPPVSLNFYDELARSDPVLYACIEVKAVNIAQQGYRLRPRWELAVLDQSLAPMMKRPEESATLDDKLEKERERIETWLDSAMPDSSFPDILAQMIRDKEALGQGYIEFSRGGNELDGMYLVKGVTLRILKSEDGYMQIRGGKRKVFTKYTADNKERRRSVLLHGQKEDTSTKGVNKKVIPVITEWGTKGKGIPQHLFKAEPVDWAEGDKVAETINELYCLKKGTTQDTPYGVPSALPALKEILGSYYASQFNVSYFENSTVPRMIIIIKGGELSDEVKIAIQNWMETQNSVDALNQILLISLPDPNVEITFEHASVSQLQDAGFGDYSDRCAERIRIAYSVPQSMMASLLGINRSVSEEANWRFLANVVRPEQRKIEALFNYIFRKDFGIENWVLDLAVPDLLSDRERAEVFSMLIARGVLSINEVRAWYGREGVDGGETPILTPAGQGALPVEFIKQIVEQNLMGPAEDQATSGMQTPPRGAPIFQKPDGKGITFEINPSVAQKLSLEHQQDMALMLEDLGYNPSVVREAFPKAYPEEEGEES